MNYALSILFSAIEFSALIVLTLCAFKFRVKKYAKEISIISLVMSCISFGLSHFELNNYAPVIQLVILILLFKVIFKESLLYSFISNILGFVLFNAIELASFQLFTNYKLVDASALGGAANATTYILQTVSSIIIYVVSIVMRYLNQGFGYVEVGIAQNRNVKTTNKYFLIISVVAMISLFVIFDLLLTNKESIYVAISAGALIILSIILIYMFKKRDREFYS
jgi:hypothetical protein